ncbi:hypothetical protein LR48_Vigan05g010200 [Vigna angularis]|uniref:Uncharacterized protein n=1 Tax=Phaseolus angularis TaxID=3914 RepID=A0A0L9UIC9_PHAAN|nr:hypothetical protein LR48_Vigan05g010200 [Vigna angularis]
MGKFNPYYENGEVGGAPQKRLLTTVIDYNVTGERSLLAGRASSRASSLDERPLLLAGRASSSARLTSVHWQELKVTKVDDGGGWRMECGWDQSEGCIMREEGQGVVKNVEVGEGVVKSVLDKIRVADAI